MACANHKTYIWYPFFPIYLVENDVPFSIYTAENEHMYNIKLYIAKRSENEPIGNLKQSSVIHINYKCILNTQIHHNNTIDNMACANHITYVWYPFFPISFVENIEPFSIYAAENEHMHNITSPMGLKLNYRSWTHLR